jgi:hypothetical protein
MPTQCFKRHLTVVSGTIYVAQRVPAMLGHILYAIYAVLLLCYVSEGYNHDKCHLRSVSSLVCTRREFGTYALSVGNLIVSLVAFNADSATAWTIYLSGQGVISFFLDTCPIMHHVFLAVYIGALLTFAVNVCNENTALWVHFYPMFGFSVFFSIAVIVNNTCGQWCYLTTQAILELYWIVSFVYFTNIYEKSIL